MANFEITKKAKKLLKKHRAKFNRQAGVGVALRQSVQVKKNREDITNHLSRLGFTKKVFVRYGTFNYTREAREFIETNAAEIGFKHKVFANKKKPVTTRVFDEFAKKIAVRAE